MMQLRKRKRHQIPSLDTNSSFKKLNFNTNFNQNSSGLSNKHKHEVIEDHHIQKKKRLYYIDNLWVSASSVMNYLLNDPVMDYMKIMDKMQNNFSNDADEETLSMSCILKNQGIAFENAVIRLLKEQKISNTYRNFIQIQYSKHDVYSYDKYLETIDAMKNGVPVIYQAILHDKTNKIYGSADLLIRNDYIQFICENIKETIPEPPAINSLNKYSKYYYIVIDIKSSTLHLRANGNTLLNGGRTAAYKGQIYLYHKMISDIQNFDSNIAFILGRKYKYVSMNQIYFGCGWFDRLGSIDFNGVDKIIKERVDKAVLWRRKVQTEYNEMFIYPEPSHINLYPNMCNKLDGKFRNRKKKLADCIGEHTLIGWVGVKHRKNAHASKIYRFDDDTCTADVLGVTGNKRKKIVETLLKMNRSKIITDIYGIRRRIPKGILFTPKKININLYNWRKSCREAYVDFETVPCVLLENYSIKIKPFTELKGQQVFLIGVWYLDDSINFNTNFRHVNERWQYKSFVARDLWDESEMLLIEKFTVFVKEQRFTKLYHWGRSAEPSMYKNAFNKYLTYYNSLTPSIQPIQHHQWCDMYTLFKSGNIGIRGAKTYGLKDVAKHMREHNFIPEIWEDQKEQNTESVNDGMGAIVTAWKINNDTHNLENDPRMSNIVLYNRMDCKILHDIMKYIRKNH